MSENILNKYEENLKTETEEQKEEIKIVPVSELKANQDHPFKVKRDENLEELMESIKENGVLNPIIARPHKYGGLEILSGHRRVYACSLLGIKEVPVLIKDIDDDSAIILMVDSNLQREKILPSEKAYAYQLRLEAMKRKAGRPNRDNGDQFGNNFDGKKSIEVIAENSMDSRNQIQRYIRLTNLIFPILDLVDENKLPMNAAVEISYLGSREQSELMNAIESEEMRSLGSYIALNLEGSSQERTFSLSIAENLIAKIQSETDIPIVIAHGPKGEDKARVLVDCYNNVYRLSLSPSIKRSAAIIKDAYIAITPDT